MTQIYNGLGAIDWNFEDAQTNGGPHSIHPYPAKFIPQIPQTLIELFHPKDESIVFDPFCGSGTTLVESVVAGIDCFGVDLHPLACMLSRVKTTRLSLNLDSIASRIICNAKVRYTSGEFEIPSIPRLDHWFELEVQKALASLVAEIRNIDVIAVQEALKIALSSIIVRVSNQESDTRYAAVHKDVSAHYVFSQFQRAASIINRAVSVQQETLWHSFGRATIINKDILKVTPEDLPRNIGLVITSPPYPNAYEYWLYHKYRMYWLGMDPIVVRANEIGARPHYFKGKSQDEHDFERQMSACFNLLSKVLLPNAKACFLVGRSIIHGRVIDNTALLQRAAQPHGFTVEGVVERLIPNRRKTFNPANSKINKEHLVVFGLKGNA